VQAVSIFIVAESEKALVTRLAGRGTEDPAELLTRVQTAKDELACSSEFDYGASAALLLLPTSLVARTAKARRHARHAKNQ
jgi:guanylate kinase